MIQSLIASLTSQPGFIDSVGSASTLAPPSFTNPQMSFSVTVNNILNHTRVNNYSGVITSPLFGQPTSWGAGRNVYFSLSSRF